MARKVPNPNGKKGSPEHQKRIWDLVVEYTAKGFRTEREYFVRVINGFKKSRFVDVAVFAGESLVYFIQVCKMNKDGKTPVKRERDAASDIQSMHPNIPLKFVDYQKDRGQNENSDNGQAG